MTHVKLQRKNLKKKYMYPDSECTCPLKTQKLCTMDQFCRIGNLRLEGFIHHVLIILLVHELLCTVYGLLASFDSF